MCVAGLLWRCWLTAAMLLAILVMVSGQLQEVSGQGLDNVNKIALDKRPLNGSYTALAIFGDFMTTRPMQVHFWRKVDQSAANTSSYKMEWETVIRPWYTGPQAWPLTQPVQIIGGEMVGIYNLAIPGPLKEKFCPTHSLVQSLDIVTTRQISIGAIVEYDDLAFPYCIALDFCEHLDCSDVTDFVLTTPLVPATTVPSGGDNGNGQGGGSGGSGGEGGNGNGGNTGRSSPVIGANIEEVVQSTDFMIGLIAWNIALTVLVFIIICVLMCIVNSIEKMNRRERRERNRVAVESAAAFPGYEVEDGDKGGASAHYGGANNDKDTLDP